MRLTGPPARQLPPVTLAARRLCWHARGVSHAPPAGRPSGGRGCRQIAVSSRSLTPLRQHAPASHSGTFRQQNRPPPSSRGLPGAAAAPGTPHVRRRAGYVSAHRRRYFYRRPADSDDDSASIPALIDGDKVLFGLAGWSDSSPACEAAAGLLPATRGPGDAENGRDHLASRSGVTDSSPRNSSISCRLTEVCEVHHWFVCSTCTKR